MISHVIWSSQRAAGEIQGLRSMIILLLLAHLITQNEKRDHTSGKVPREKTINKQVLPHAPSPTITSFLLSSEDIVVNLKDIHLVNKHVFSCLKHPHNRRKNVYVYKCVWEEMMERDAYVGKKETWANSGRHLDTWTRGNAAQTFCREAGIRSDKEELRYNRESVKEREI